MNNELLPATINEMADEFAEIVVATSREQPDPDDLDRLRVYLRRYPEVSSVLGDLNAEIMERLLDSYRAQPAKLESVVAFCRRMKDDLGYAGASLLERSLINQIVTNWLHHQQVTAIYQERLERGPDAAAVSFWEKRVESAQRRYLRMVESLMRVRRLASRTPLMQVNILQQAVFTGSGHSAAARATIEPSQEGIDT